jgi:integrase
MRNPNGYGGVVKLPGRRRKPWGARVTVWEGEKQKYKYIGYAKTKAGAQLILASHHVNPISPKADMTLGQLYDEWKATKYPEISKSTADNYRAAWLYLQPDAAVKVSDYRTAHIQRRIKAAHDAGMSASTLQKIRTLAVQLLDMATSEDLVTKNYAKFVTMPRVEKKKRGRFSDLDIKILWDNVDVPWVDTILIMIYTGMRPGEMLGLTRFAVDWNQQTITGGIKTDAGKDRVIPIHPKIMPLVKKWYDKNGATLICENGGPIKLKRYRELLYYPVLEQLGLPKLTPHCCRHTFASMMSDAGVDPKEIQEIIGHASYSTTADTYTHKDIAKLSKAIRQI